MSPINAAEVWQLTLEHLRLSLLALLAAVALAVPLAIWLEPRRRWANGLLQATAVIQTIPSLALLGLLIPLVGIGPLPALIALTLYALLPIFQNTYLGLSQIDPAIREAHTAFGLSRWQALWRIELPMALPALLAGIRTAAVLIIGTATLAALIGAGGLGQLILLGIDRHNLAMTFTGALLAALLALLVSAAIGWLQRVKSRGVLLLALALLALAAGPLFRPGATPAIVIAGKLGSEPDILINMYKLLIEEEAPKLKVELKPNFGKTDFLFRALNSGAIDIYPEFTGTVLESLVQLPAGAGGRLNPEETYVRARDLLAEQYRLRLLPPMAYQNTYALAVPAAYARRQQLEKISHLRKVQNSVRAGFTLEFSDRPDGYRGLQARGISFPHLTTLEPALRYNALSAGQIDLIDAYSTDSELRQYDLTMLADDLELFPPYQGAPLLREQFAAARPEVVRALNRLAGQISAADMSAMNYRVKVDGEPAAAVARDYLEKHGLLRVKND